MTIRRGDSAEVLPALLGQIDEPCLFWLDGHYSGPKTGRGETDTPILRELEAIFAHRVKTHVVIIDDARGYGTLAGYPTVEGLREFVRAHDPQLVFDIQHDLIRIHRP